MTLQELSVLHDLTQEIDMDEERLRQLDKENGTKKQKAKVRKIIREKRNRLWAERERMEQWIAEIDDSITRQIFTHRFVKGKTWLQVANDMKGNHTQESVRAIAKRYIKRLEKVVRS